MTAYSGSRCSTPRTIRPRVRAGRARMPMHISYDSETNAAYLAIEHDIPSGSATENVLVERAGRGDIVLDFSSAGHLLGVEIISARELLGAAVLSAADEL
jgi:uncharacterized protein YuzE